MYIPGLGHGANPTVTGGEVFIRRNGKMDTGQTNQNLLKVEEMNSILFSKKKLASIY